MTERTLPVLIRTTMRADGTRQISLRVFCPARCASVGLDDCQACGSRLRIATEPAGVPCTVICTPRSIQPLEGPPVDEAKQDLAAGAVVKGRVLCVQHDVPVMKLLSLFAERELREVFVVDERGAIAGVIRDADLVFDPSREYPSLSHDPRVAKFLALEFAQRQAQLTAKDVMASSLSFPEATSIRKILIQMALHHLRQVPVVDPAGELIGAFTDIEGLKHLRR